MEGKTLGLPSPCLLACHLCADHQHQQERGLPSPQGMNTCLKSCSTQLCLLCPSSSQLPGRLGFEPLTHALLYWACALDTYNKIHRGFPFVLLGLWGVEELGFSLFLPGDDSSRHFLSLPLPPTSPLLLFSVTVYSLLVTYWVSHNCVLARHSA